MNRKPNELTRGRIVSGLAEWIRDELGIMIEEQTGGKIRHSLTQAHENASGSESLIIHLNDKRVITISVSVEK